MRWARYRGWRLDEETVQGNRVRIRLRFDVEEEGLQFALSFGADVEVIEPVELRAKVVTAAQRIVAAYTPDPR
jgi:predicted DNA-binding transcriptional regulator YafY